MRSLALFSVLLFSCMLLAPARAAGATIACRLHSPVAVGGDLLLPCLVRREAAPVRTCIYNFETDRPIVSSRSGDAFAVSLELGGQRVFSDSAVGSWDLPRCVQHAAAATSADGTVVEEEVADMMFRVSCRNWWMPCSLFVNVNLDAGRCGNGICEPELWESGSSCPEDCHVSRPGSGSGSHTQQPPDLIIPRLIHTFDLRQAGSGNSTSGNSTSGNSTSTGNSTTTFTTTSTSTTTTTTTTSSSTTTTTGGGTGATPSGSRTPTPTSSSSPTPSPDTAQATPSLSSASGSGGGGSSGGDVPIAAIVGAAVGGAVLIGCCVAVCLIVVIIIIVVVVAGGGAAALGTFFTCKWCSPDRRHRTFTRHRQDGDAADNILFSGGF